MTETRRVVLASASPRRKAILTTYFPNLEIAPAAIDETCVKMTDAGQLAAELARLKAEVVGKNYSRALVVAADTVVVCQDKILGKPEDEADAIQILGLLSGTAHKVITAVALLKPGSGGRFEACVFCETTVVEFGHLAPDDIEAYVKTGSPMDKAGAYGIQDAWGTRFVARIEGDYHNVVGFPIFRFFEKLRDFAPEWLP